MKTKKTTRVSKRHQINEFNPVATSAYGKGRDMTFRERNKINNIPKILPKRVR